MARRTWEDVPIVEIEVNSDDEPVITLSQYLSIQALSKSETQGWVELLEVIQADSSTLQWTLRASLDNLWFQREDSLCMKARYNYMEGETRFTVFDRDNAWLFQHPTITHLTSWLDAVEDGLPPGLAPTVD